MLKEVAEGRTLEFTSTWVVAVVCCVLVLISFLVHRFLQCVGQLLTRPYTKGPRTGKGRRKHLFNALQKIKDELMLLGFTSLLLSVSEASIGKICIPESHANVWLPCHRPSNSSCTTTAHSANPIASHGHQGRRLLTGAKDYCCRKGKVPLLSPTSLHHLHIFIFMLATFHVIVCVVIILCGEAKLHHWRQWDKSIIKDGHYIKEEDLRSLLTRLPKKDSKGGKRCPVIGWLHIFFKHIFSSLTKLEYITIRVNCIKAQDLKTPEDDFQKYIIGSVQKDFDKVVGISWYLWLLTVLFLLLNIAGLNAYFWISFLPLTLLLAVGTKLEHIVEQWTEKITKKSDLSAGASESTVTAIEFSEEDFWFHKPHLVLDLIHIILFQNSFQLAFFFFVLYQYHLSSCMMGEVGYVIPRLVIGVCVQLICSYRTLPLYVIMKSQMRPKNRPKKKKFMKIVSFIWDNIDKWNERKMATNNGSTRGGSSEGIVANEQAKVGEIEPEKEADIELQDGTNPARTLKPGEQQLV